MSIRKTSVGVLVVLWIGAMEVVVALTGCNQQNAAIVSSTVAAPAAPSQTPTPSSQDAPATAIRPTSTPDARATAAACKPAAQVTDVTVPDGSQLKPGQALVKTWRLLNSGNCAWEKGSALVFQSGERFDAPEAIPVGAVDVGQSVDVSATIKAPQSLGTYVGLWVFRQPSGQIITTTAVRIVVLVPAPAPGAAVAPPVARPPMRTSANIPPVGSGPFGVDEQASGPWNCVRRAGSDGWRYWVGDFYITVRGGPGNYTISDPENCRWDFGEQKFVCRYSEALGQFAIRTLEVSCPGCAPQKVSVYGRGDNDATDSSTCQVPRWP